jgi:histidinol dehydrogenase
MRIIEAKNRRMVEALLTRDARADAAFDKRVRDIVNRVRRGGDRALSRFAERFDGTTGALEVSKAEMRDYASLVAPDVRRALRTAARNIARSRPARFKHWDLSVVRRVNRAARRAARARQLLRPRRTLSCRPPAR